MGWNDHLLNAGEDEEIKDADDLDRDKLLVNMRKSDAYKVGFLRSAVRTAISMLEGDHVKEALSMLKASYETERRDK